MLKELAEGIRNGEMPNVRLILVDFDRDKLPWEWRDDVRYDRAILPNIEHVKDWCVKLANAAKRKHTVADAEQWVSEVFSQIDDFKINDGTWQKQLERRLCQTIERIMACEELP